MVIASPAVVTKLVNNYPNSLAIIPPIIVNKHSKNVNNLLGSRSLQCNTEGKCQCKPGVTGDKCDQCAPNFYEFGSFGCSSCDCEQAGSFNNSPSCDPVTGACACKENVEGKRCRS